MNAMGCWLAVLAVGLVLFCSHVDGKSPEQERSQANRRENKFVTFRLFTRETVNRPETVLSNQKKPFRNFKPGKPVKVVVHGWKGHNDCTFSKTMREAVFPHLDVNLVMVDWSTHGSRTKVYPLARSEVPEVGRLLAEFLDFFAGAHKVRLQDLHLIGHSLGGHVVGIAGRKVRSGRIGRITGSDPAGPQFSAKDKEGRLSPDSAEFVDVIHTTCNYLGFGEPLGHVDFYPNSGHAVQPGCGFDIKGRCSHRRAYYLLQESIKRPQAFPAVACKSWDDFTKNRCQTNNVVFMGMSTPKTARGLYFLQTNGATPFGKGSAGTRFSA